MFPIAGELVSEPRPLRMISAFWYVTVFMLMMLYSGTLRAHMTLKSIKAPIHNIHDLANQDEILPSIQGFGSHETWFMVSIYLTHQFSINWDPLL